MACFKDGEPCGTGFITGVDYQPEQKLDLTQAKVSRTTVNGAPGYSVEGNQDTFVGTSDQSTEGNYVDVFATCDAAGIDWEGFQWYVRETNAVCAAY
jgi:hypothetical protein